MYGYDYVCLCELYLYTFAHDPCMHGVTTILYIYCYINKFFTCEWNCILLGVWVGEIANECYYKYQHNNFPVGSDKIPKIGPSRLFSCVSVTR